MTLRIKKILPVTLVAIMIMATFGLTGVSAAGQGAFGSQVEICEVDDTYILQPLPGGAVIRYRNNAPATYGWEDDFYLDADGSGLVSPNDIRITSAASRAPGSQVVNGEGDIGRPLAVNPGGRILCFTNKVLNPPPAYDLGDPVVLSVPSFVPGLIANDVRISLDIGNAMGDLVAGGATDIGIRTIALAGNWAYYDVDGNGFYNQGDHVIRDVDADGMGTLNDLRLTPFDACGQNYKEGTKISYSRLDAVHFLNTPGFTIGFSDIDGVAGYSLGDPVYIHLAPPFGFVGSEDVRLTSYAGNVAGSQVVATATDFGNALANVPIGNIQFLDMTGDGYSLDDPVYLDMPPFDNQVSLNDVILTDGTSNLAGTPGTKVNSGSPYQGLTILPMPVGTTLAFYDTNGDAVFSMGDFVLLDIGPLAVRGHSTTNDVRLTQPTFGYAFGTKVEPTDNCCVDPLQPIPNAIVSWDMTGDGFSHDDPVYVGTVFGGAPWDVAANYIRLTPMSHPTEYHAAGTVVASGDFDDLKNTNFIPINQILYHDRTSDGITPDDPIFIDTLNSGNINEFDVRLTPYAGFEAGSKVAVGDGDALFGQPLSAFPNGAPFISFVDVNSRGANFDAADYAYLDVMRDRFASTNDVRLTGNGGPEPNLYDTNNNCIMELGEMMNAIGDWKVGTLSLGDMMQIIGFWKLGAVGYC